MALASFERRPTTRSSFKLPFDLLLCQSLLLHSEHFSVRLYLGMRQTNLTVSCLYKVNTVKQNRLLLTHALTECALVTANVVETCTLLAQYRLGEGYSLLADQEHSQPLMHLLCLSMGRNVPRLN